MLFDISWLEWLGYLSSVVVAISLTMSSIIKLRLLNLLGGIAFSVYGFMIGSLPVGFLNTFIVCVNIYYLIKIYAKKDTFKLLKLNFSDNYLKYYLEYNKNEIKHFFPNFTTLNISDDKTNILIFSLLHNEVVAGVFIGIKNANVLNVVLDYVSAPYRDLKPGEFLYQQNKSLFEENNIHKVVISTDNELHINYLKEMNFSLEQSGMYCLTLNSSSN